MERDTFVGIHAHALVKHDTNSLVFLWLPDAVIGHFWADFARVDQFGLIVTFQRQADIGFLRFIMP